MTATDNKQPPEPVVIKRDELPAYCPTESMGLWNSHPRVYIPLEESDTADCPYCGTRFVLAE
jgi:uncharacterized Zn-finger protein